MADKPIWWDEVKRQWERAGTPVPMKVWLALLLAESGGDPNAHLNACYPYQGQTICEDSVGLYQLNRIGGQGVDANGKPYPVPFLLEPGNNTAIALKAIAPAYRANKDSIVDIALNSGHPGANVARNDPRILNIQRIYNEISSLNEDQTLKYLKQKWPQAYVDTTVTPGETGGIPSDSSDSNPFQQWIDNIVTTLQGGAKDQITGVIARPTFLLVGAILFFIGILALAFTAYKSTPPEIRQAVETAAIVAK